MLAGDGQVGNLTSRWGIANSWFDICQVKLCNIHCPRWWPGGKFLGLVTHSAQSTLFDVSISYLRRERSRFKI